MSNQNPFISSATQRIYLGELRTPDEVADVLAERSAEEQARIGKRWLLCGNVTPPMFNALRYTPVDGIAQRLGGYVSPAGAAYAVHTHQVGRHQHRLLLPVFDADVRRAIRAMNDEPFGFLLSKDRQEDSLMLLSSSISGHDFQGLPGLDEELSDDALGRAVAELPDFVMYMSGVQSIPSPLEGPVESISLSFVMPFHSLARLDLSLSEVLA